MNWKEQNEPIGKSLGYPKCCIDEFCRDSPEVLKNRRLTQSDRDRYKAAHLNGTYTGFIPCAKHAREILSGQTTLLELIKNRSVYYPPFPFA